MERKLIAAAVSSALALPMAAQAVEFSVSGQINRAIISVDGGGPNGMPDTHNGDVTHVDSNASSTRFRFTGSEELENGMTAGVQLEFDNFFAGDNAGLNPPVSGNQEHSTRTIRTRHGNVYLSTAGGKITIGKGSAAADGMAHADLGGPSWLGGATNWCSYAAFNGPACPSNDGGRKEVLRYDTPAIGPASIAVSTGNNDYFDIKLSIAGSMGDAGYDLRIGHIAEYEKVDVTPPWEDSMRVITDTGDITTMSGSVSFGQGTSVSAAWSQEDTGSQVEYQYMKLDHSYGDGSIGVYYKTGEYGAGEKDGVEGAVWGIGIGHSLGGGATAYAGYRQISEDKMKDIDLLLAGMRVTFN